MTSYSTDGKVGPWAEEKLDCLQNYLEAYTKILRKQRWVSNFYYVDTFAGRGISEVRHADRQDSGTDSIGRDLLGYSPASEEEKQYLGGSPIRALKIPYPFSGYLFIESSAERVQLLKEISRNFAHTRKIKILQGDANDILIRNVANNPKIDWKNSRAVVFLDPFGMQVPWSTLVKLASTGAIEVFVNFPVGHAIQRLLERHGRITESRKSLLNQYFDTDEWWDIVYETRTTLFDTETVKVEESGARLASWYARRLEGLFGFGASPRLIRNSKGGHLYYLLFAGPNKTGARIADYILSQGEVET